MTSVQAVGTGNTLSVPMSMTCRKKVATKRSSPKFKLRWQDYMRVLTETRPGRVPITAHWTTQDTLWLWRSNEPWEEREREPEKGLLQLRLKSKKKKRKGTPLMVCMSCTLD